MHMGEIQEHDEGWIGRVTATWWRIGGTRNPHPNLVKQGTLLNKLVALEEKVLMGRQASPVPKVSVLALWTNWKDRWTSHWEQRGKKVALQLRLYVYRWQRRTRLKVRRKLVL